MLGSVTVRRVLQNGSLSEEVEKVPQNCAIAFPWIVKKLPSPQ